MLTTLRTSLTFLSRSMRLRWAGLIPLAALGALLEAMGAAAVFALIRVISDPSRISSLPVLSAIYTRLPWQGEQAILLFFTVLVALFYVIKNGFLVMATYLKQKVASDSMAALSYRMLRGYLSVPYAFYFQRSSAELIRNTSESVEGVVRLVLMASLNIVSETLFVVGLILVLLRTAPGVTLVAVFLLAAVLAVLLKGTRRIVIRWGARQHELKRTILQVLQQNFSGLKEIRVMGREGFFFDLFARRQEVFFRIRSLHATLEAIPHLLIETVFVCGMLLVIALVTLYRHTSPDMVPLLGLYAYVGFRMLPSLSRILVAVNNIRYGAAATLRLATDLHAFTRLPDGRFPASVEGLLPFTEQIVLEHMTYAYEGTPVPVLDDVTLTIRRGESIGIVGATGAGKSTLIDLILGLLQPGSGRITVDGRDIAHSLRAWRQKIGYVPQSIFLLDDTVRRNIAFGLRDSDIQEEKVWAAARMAQLEEDLTSLPQGLDTVIGERGIRLSGGQRQRVAIARALYSEPEVLVFDEATSALDNQTEQEVIRSIEALRGEKTLLIIAHRLSTVRACDRLVFLHDGRVAGCGSFAELAAQCGEFRRMAVLAEGQELRL